jgi:hypothetical protein
MPNCPRRYQRGLWPALGVGVLVACLGCESREHSNQAKTQDVLSSLRTTPRVFVADGAQDYHVDLTGAKLSDEGIAELIASVSSDALTSTIYRDDKGDRPDPLSCRYRHGTMLIAQMPHLALITTKPNLQRLDGR